MRGRALARLVAAIALTVFAIGAALQPLQLPGFTAELSARYSEGAQAGLTAEQTAELAERVRQFVVAGPVALPSEYGGRPAFDDSAVSHLEDVREVIWAANLVTGMLVIALAVWVGVAAAQGRLWDVASAFFLASGITFGLVFLGALVALLDFDTFFAGFHSLFFAPGTWTFPSGSLLIQLFPEPFWAISGLSWAALCLLAAGLYLLVGAALRRRSRMVCTTAHDSNT